MEAEDRHKTSRGIGESHTACWRCCLATTSRERRGHLAGYKVSTALTLFFLVLLTGGVHSQSPPAHTEAVACQPHQVHIAYGDDVTQVVVVWATLQQCSAVVSYGTSEWTFDHQVTGVSLEFTDHNQKGLPFLHRVKLEGLTPSTTYFYQPLSFNMSAGPFYFKTPPEGAAWTPSFLVYGDLGVHTESIPALTQEALTGKYTAVLHVGDFAYNLRDEDGQVGDLFMTLIEEMASHLPYMTSPGNHEIDDDTFANYRYRFSMPGSEWPIPKDKMWYSFNVGPVHFVSYSTEVFFTEGGQHVAAQRRWLIQDLQEANKHRDLQPWVIAFGHRPMYCSNDDDDDCTHSNSSVRAGLEDLLYLQGVDLVLAGHVPHYERLWPVYRNVTLGKNFSEPQAPVQINVGASGGPELNDTEADGNATAEWSAFRLDNKALNSYGVLRVHNTSHLYWEQRSVHDHGLLDSVWVTKTSHGPNHQEELPANISEKIKESIEQSSRPPDDLSIQPTKAPGVESEKVSLIEGDTTQRIAIGASFAGLAAVVVFAAVVVHVCRKRRRRSRRWDRLDMHYGKKLYQPAQDTDQDLDNDFEIDMSDGTLPTAKLLNSN